VNKHVAFETIPTEPKVLYRVGDVAAMLSIGRTAAWELVRKGTIRSVRIGRTRRVPMLAIHEYVERLLAEEVA
jgi:excisionase family DNA binding protein